MFLTTLVKTIQDGELERNEEKFSGRWEKKRINPHQAFKSIKDCDSFLSDLEMKSIQHYYKEFLIPNIKMNLVKVFYLKQTKCQ